jgi:hypothetical protein
MHAAAIDFFGRPLPEVVLIRKEIEDHLTYLNCETRNSTPATCQEWKTSLVDFGSRRSNDGAPVR